MSASRSGLTRRVQRWREHWRQGPASFAYSVWRRAGARLGLGAWCDFQAHEILAVPPWRLLIPPRLPRSMSVRELDGGDVAALERLRPSQGRSYPQRFQQGERGWGAFLAEAPAAVERLVAFVWFRRGPGHVPASLGCRWQLSEPMAWIYDLYSDPQVLGAVPSLYAHLRQHPPGDNLRLLVGQTDCENLRSRLAHRSLGYETCAHLFSFRCGGWGFHVSRRVGRRPRPRWRWHAHQGLIPLFLFADPGEAVAADSRLSRHEVLIQCVCGQNVACPELAHGSEGSERILCRCGRAVGDRREGVTHLGVPMPYWGEIPERQMEHLLARAQAAGWRTAVRELAPHGLADYVASPSRAAFADLLPLPAAARILDVGAGWGAIAAPLARHYSVVALEGVSARARFIALRQQQDGLSRLHVVCGDLHQSPLALGQFDAIVANGIFEWVPLLDRSASPMAVQLLFLHRLRELLAPGGRLYLGIESRLSWDVLKGGLDHSGLPFTSLLPRPLARWVCARSRGYRAKFNTGYRTYTYTHRGYRKLFAQVGLRPEFSWLCPHGYNDPQKMLPFHTPALRFATGHGRMRWPQRLAWRAAATAPVSRWMGASFAFLLTADDGRVGARPLQGAADA